MGGGFCLDPSTIKRSDYQGLTRAHYDAVAQILPTVYNPLYYDDLLGMVISQIKCPSSQPMVLDLGCGYGRLLPVLNEVGITNVVGLDNSPGMIEEGRRQYPSADFRIGDMCALPEIFEPETFDAVFAIASIMHVLPENMPLVIEGMRHVMKKGAIALVSTPAGNTEIIFKPETSDVPLSPESEYIYRTQWTLNGLGKEFISRGFEAIQPTHVYCEMLYLVVRAI